MSTTITDAFVQQYADDFHLLAQQSKSRLERYVNPRGKITGSAFTVEPLANAAYQEITTRHGDTPIGNMVNTRRFGDMRDSEVPADLLDSMDEIKLLANPKNRYSQNHLSAHNRFKDKVIIDALLGTVRTQLAGVGGTSALPAAQQIANGGTGLTISKLLQAKYLLDQAEMDDSAFFEMNGLAADNAEPSYIFVFSSRGMMQLLNTTEVKSADYNTVKSLANGTINTFMGFRFVKIESLPKVGAIRSGIAYAPRALHFGIGKDPSAMIDKRPDKRNAWQVYSDSSFGAARAEDTGVVQVDYDET